MTQTEFIEAFEVASRKNWKVSPTWKPSQIQWAILTELYISDEMDSVAVGPNRHERFAAWCLDNEERIHELVNERYKAIDEKTQVLQTQAALLARRIEMIKIGLEAA